MATTNTKQYGAINEPNQVPFVEINIDSNHWQPTPREARRQAKEARRQAKMEARQARRESRQARREESRITINDQDVPVECNACCCLCGCLCRVIGFCLWLFGFYLLYCFIKFVLLWITCPTNIIIVDNNPICRPL